MAGKNPSAIIALF